MESEEELAPTPDTLFLDIRLNSPLESLLKHGMYQYSFSKEYILYQVTQAGEIYIDNHPKGENDVAYTVEYDYPTRTLKAEKRYHNRLRRAANKHDLHICFARIKLHLKKGEVSCREWWWWHFRRFPENISQNSILIYERILPFSDTLQKAIINSLRSRESINGNTRSNISDKPLHSLLPLLSTDISGSVHHRNRALGPKDLQRLDINPFDLAIQMADFLALSYFSLGSDARGVEFIIAPTRQSQDCDSKQHFSSDVFGDWSLWVTSLDQLQDFCLCSKGMEQAVDAYMQNEQVPKPTGIITDGLVLLNSDHNSKETDQDKIWKVFKKQFVNTSNIILANKNLDDPGKLVEEFVAYVEDIVSGQRMIGTISSRIIECGLVDEDTNSSVLSSNSSGTSSNCFLPTIENSKSHTCRIGKKPRKTIKEPSSNSNTDVWSLIDEEKVPKQSDTLQETRMAKVERLIMSAANSTITTAAVDKASQFLDTVADMSEELRTKIFGQRS